jgi:hypothetical protein
MAQRAGAVKSILIRPAVRVFDPILRCPDAYGRRRTVTGLKQRFGENRVDLMAYGRTPWS